MAVGGAPVTIVQAVDSPVPVNVVGTEGDINLTGDVIVDTFGTLADAAETDPDAASATIPALLRGILSQNAMIISQNVTIIAHLAAIEANTDPA